MRGRSVSLQCIQFSPVNAATKLNEGKIQNEFSIGANLQRNYVIRGKNCTLFSL